MSLKDFIEEHFPHAYYSYITLFHDISKIEYVDLEDYKLELLNVNSELKDIERTIKYFEERHKVLTNWKNTLENKLGRWNNEDTCYNCKYYNKQYCKKFKFNVESDATCHDFEWRNKVE